MTNLMASGSDKWDTVWNAEDGGAGPKHLTLPLILGPALAELVLIHLLLAAPSLRDQILFLMADVALFWLLRLMLKGAENTERVTLLAIGNANFASLCGAALFGHRALLFVPWVAAVWLSGMLRLGHLRGIVTAAGLAVFAFITSRLFFPFGSEAVSAQVTAHAFVLCIFAVGCYLCITIYARPLVQRSRLRQPEPTMGELRQRAEAMEAADREMSCLFAEASRAIRDPLDGIIGYSEIILEERGGIFSGPQLDDMRRIHEASQQLLSLVNGVFDLSEIETSHSALLRSERDYRGGLGTVR